MLGVGKISLFFAGLTAVAGQVNDKPAKAKIGVYWWTPEPLSGTHAKAGGNPVFTDATGKDNSNLCPLTRMGTVANHCDASYYSDNGKLKKGYTVDKDTNMCNCDAGYTWAYTGRDSTSVSECVVCRDLGSDMGAAIGKVGAAAHAGRSIVNFEKHNRLCLPKIDLPKNCFKECPYGNCQPTTATGECVCYAHYGWKWIGWAWTCLMCPSDDPSRTAAKNLEPSYTSAEGQCAGAFTPDVKPEAWVDLGAGACSSKDDTAGIAFETVTVADLAACKTACIDLKPKHCVFANWNEGTQECHLGREPATTTVTVPAVDNDLACWKRDFPGWSGALGACRTADWGGAKGLKITAEHWGADATPITEFAECQQACVENRGCQAIEYFSDLPTWRCELHFEAVANVLDVPYNISCWQAPQDSNNAAGRLDTFRTWWEYDRLTTEQVKMANTAVHLAACQQACTDRVDCGFIEYYIPPALAAEAMSGTGADYAGKASATISGKTCQKWSMITPHAGAADQHASDPDKFGDHNYCRTESTDPCDDIEGTCNTIWCWTTDAGTETEKCEPLYMPPVCTLYSSSSTACDTQTTEVNTKVYTIKRSSIDVPAAWTSQAVGAELPYMGETWPMTEFCDKWADGSVYVCASGKSVSYAHGVAGADNSCDCVKGYAWHFQGTVANPNGEWGCSKCHQGAELDLYKDKCCAAGPLYTCKAGCGALQNCMGGDAATGQCLCEDGYGFIWTGDPETYGWNCAKCPDGEAASASECANPPPTPAPPTSAPATGTSGSGNSSTNGASNTSATTVAPAAPAPAPPAVASKGTHMFARPAHAVFLTISALTFAIAQFM